jgi:hypothetical protein
MMMPMGTLANHYDTKVFMLKKTHKYWYIGKMEKNAYPKKDSRIPR